jgi:predicted nucleotidyltransferase
LRIATARGEIRMTSATLQRIVDRGIEKGDVFGVARLAVFGSVARGEAEAESDVDLLVEFAGTPSFDGFMDLKYFLEELLARKVDLVTSKSLRPRLRPTIERELVDVA